MGQLRNCFSRQKNGFQSLESSIGFFMTCLGRSIGGRRVDSGRARGESRRLDQRKGPRGFAMPNGSLEGVIGVVTNIHAHLQTSEGVYCMV